MFGSVDIYLDEKEYNDLKKNGFDSSYGYHLWNVAVMVAPYDTGNLRRSIKLTSNSAKTIKISYDLAQANYAKFLEEGLGPVKKYKGFISKATYFLIYDQLVGLISSRENMPIYSLRPIVALKTSKHQPFSWERRFLKGADVNSSRVDATNRQTISKIRDLNYISSMGGKKLTSKVSGRTPQIENKQGRSNHSNLRAVYKARLEYEKVKNQLT